MKDILDLAQMWLEHCRDQLDYFTKEEDAVGIDAWTQRAEEAERIIKNFIDHGVYAGT